MFKSNYVLHCPLSILQLNSKMALGLPEQLLRSASRGFVVTFLCMSGYGAGLCIGYASMHRVQHSFDAEA